MQLYLTRLAVTLAAILPLQFAQAADKPNILVIWGDDIGQFNVSAYNMGMMGYKTPNIDRIAAEGAVFTDWYGQQSCTAGRAAFITGQSPMRTGLTKVGLPGAPEGMKKEDPTIAGLLKAQGYVTGQFGARGVIHSYADGRIEDTGPLTRKRMETIDEDVTTAAIQFMEEAVKADKPFFVWWNSTRMHIWTHLKPASVGVTGLGVYADGMVEHDGMVGQLLDSLENLGVADNTIVMYSTDNGAEVFSWPDGGTTMFRGEKASQWEGGFRVPTAIRWPGVIKPGTVSNNIGAHEDMMTTLLAAAGQPNIKGEAEWPRHEFESIGYDKWWVEHMFIFAPGAAYIGKWLQSFKEFPPRQEPGSFNLEKVMAAITKGAGDK